MNRQTIGAMMENYDVAMLAGHNVMYYSDSLKGDSMQNHLNRIPKSFKTVILIYLVLFLAGFSSKFTKSQWQKEREQTCIISFRVIIACIFAHRKSGMIVDFAETAIAT